MAEPHAVQLQGKKWVAVVLVALKCEVGQGYMNDAITVVNFGESIAHNVYKPWWVYVCSICKKDHSITEFRQHSHPMYRIQVKNNTLVAGKS